MFARSQFAARPFAAVNPVAATGIPVTGAPMSAVAGTVGSLINPSLIGALATFSAGSVAPSVSKSASATGAAAFFSAGTAGISSSAAFTLTGAAASYAAGTTSHSSSASLSLSGVSASYAAGAVSPSSVVGVPITGAGASYIAGTASPRDLVALLGASAVYQAGASASSLAFQLTGGSAQFTAGNISVFQLRVVGASATFAAGLLIEVPVSGQQVSSGYMQILRVYPRIYSWPEKDPGDALIYGFDVQDWLGRDGLTLLSFSASINNATDITASGLLQDGLVNTGLWLQLYAGTSGLVTQVTLNLNCLTADGLTTQRTAKVALPVQSRTPSAATSYPATTPRVLLPGNEYTVVIEEALGTYQQYFHNLRGASDTIIDQLMLGSWLQEAGMTLTGATLLLSGGLAPNALGLLVDASENVGVWFSLSGGTSGSVAQCAVQFTMVDTVGLTNSFTVSFVVSFT